MAVLKGMLCRCTLVLCGRPTRAPCASQRPCFPSNRRHPFGQATEVQYGYMRPFRSIPIFVTCAYRPHAVRPLTRSGGEGERREGEQRPTAREHARKPGSEFPSALGSHHPNSIRVHHSIRSGVLTEMLSPCNVRMYLPRGMIGSFTVIAASGDEPFCTSNVMISLPSKSRMCPTRYTRPSTILNVSVPCEGLGYSTNPDRSWLVCFGAESPPGKVRFSPPFGVINEKLWFTVSLRRICSESISTGVRLSNDNVSAFRPK